jgi:parvulin-like peptidyl-prolyl isomerase
LRVLLLTCCCQISQPITTAFGVHLLKISEIKAGKSSWRDAKIQLKKSATKFLFDWIVQKQLQESKVEFKGNSPYFELTSGKLVVPEK